MAIRTATAHARARGVRGLGGVAEIEVHAGFDAQLLRELAEALGAGT